MHNQFEERLHFIRISLILFKSYCALLRNKVVNELIKHFLIVPKVPEVLLHANKPLRRKLNFQIDFKHSLNWFWKLRYYSLSRS